jgi:hypothetical protein
MRRNLPALAVIVAATMLASACAYVFVPAEAQGIVKDGKKSATTKGPGKGTATKAPVTTYKAAKKAPPVFAEKPPIFAKKAPVIAKKAPPVFAKKPPIFAKKAPVIAKKAPPVFAKKPPIFAKKPPTLAKKRPPVVVYHRPWRPGLRWRWLVVPTIIIAQNLEWCHYHRYPIAGVRFHRGIECHEHAWWVPWDHPSIRYVEAY